VDVVQYRLWLVVKSKKPTPVGFRCSKICLAGFVLIHIYIVYGIWYMVYGIWYMVYGIWYMAYIYISYPHQTTFRSWPSGRRGDIAYQDSSNGGHLGGKRLLKSKCTRHSITIYPMVSACVGRFTTIVCGGLR